MYDIDLNFEKQKPKIKEKRRNIIPLIRFNFI